MCVDPVTATIISMGVTAGGKMIDASRQAGAEERNAARAEQNAREIRALGALDAHDFREQKEFQLGGQEAQLVASGLDLNSASPNELMFDSRQAVERDALKMALGVDVKSNGMHREADNRRQRASDIMLSGVVGAATTFAGDKKFWRALQ